MRHIYLRPEKNRIRDGWPRLLVDWIRTLESYFEGIGGNDVGYDGDFQPAYGGSRESSTQIVARLLTSHSCTHVFAVLQQLPNERSGNVAWSLRNDD